MHVIGTLATGGTENGIRKLLSSLDPVRFEQKVCMLRQAPGLIPAGTICIGRTPDRFTFLVPRLRRVFARERPDIVHSRNWPTIEAIAAAKLSAVPAIVHSEHGRDLEYLDAAPFRRRWLRRLSYAWADRLFCVSEELKRYYCKELAWKPNDMHVIPNGVDVEHFRPNARTRQQIRARLEAAEGTIVVGTVGRLDPIKDHRTLLRAAEMALARGMDLRLAIVGDGVERARLEQALARTTNLARSTVLVGNSTNVADWLNGFDVFVLPSLAEGMSNTLLEAMAVGVVPIATAVGGNPEVIEEGRSGLLVAPKDAERISRLLLELAGQKEWRNRLRVNARQRVISQFSLERMVERYTELYCQLMEARQQSARVPHRVRQARERDTFGVEAKG